MIEYAAQMRKIAELKARVDQRLSELAPAEGAEPRALVDASRYALLAPGKRLRPLICLLTALECGGSVEAALDVACALEMIHAASLILDDLPAMDDAGLRRGRPTTHRAYGEATAILAAVALLNQAFVVAAAAPLAASLRADAVARLSESVGFEGLTAGQARDLAARDHIRSPAEMELLNHQKTGVLIMASAQIGAASAGASAQVVLEAGEFARRLGLAFQIRDDLLDLEETPEAMGKDAGKDAGMTTVASSLGEAGARVLIEEHLNAALAALARAGIDGALGVYARSLFADRLVAA